MGMRAKSKDEPVAEDLCSLISAYPGEVPDAASTHGLCAKVRMVALVSFDYLMLKMEMCLFLRNLEIVSTTNQPGVNPNMWGSRWSDWRWRLIG